MKKLYPFFLILLSLATGCSNKQKNDHTLKNILIDSTKHNTIDSKVSWTKINNLGENLETLGEINSFDFVDKDRLIISVSNPTRVMLYHKNGKLIRKVGNKGRGPFEYISPSLVRSNDQKIYIWCEGLLKLLVFDSNGKPIEKYKFSKAIKDFIIYNNYAGFYTVGGSDAQIFKIYNLNTKEVIGAFGTKTNEHKLLNVFKSSGGLTKYKKNVFFAPSDKLHIYKINMENFSKAKYNIDDNEFKVETINEKPQEYIHQPEKAFKYFYKNDIITDLFCLNDKIILTAQLGKVEIENFKLNRNGRKGKVNIEMNDPSKKKYKYYVFNKGMKLESFLYDTIKDIRNENNCFYASNGKYLYKIEYKDEDSIYKLSRMNFHQIKDSPTK